MEKATKKVCVYGLSGKPFGEVMEDIKMKELVKGIMKEAVALDKTKGIDRCYCE